MPTDPRLIITLFGAPCFYLGTESVEGFVSNKVRALAAYLVVTSHLHTRDALAGLLWGDMPNVDARANLRKALSNLRQLFPGVFHIDRNTVAFNQEYPHTLDVATFSDLLARYRAEESAENAVELLEEAVLLYQGEFLAGFYLPDAALFSEWAFHWREQLNAQALQVLNRLGKHCVEKRQYEKAVLYFKRVLAIDPWREDAHRQVMLCLARMGQYNAALAQYHLCQKTLTKELDVLPSPETRLLYDRIATRKATRRVDIPNQPTSFVDRQEEKEDILSQLLQPDCRLLTLVGLGGVGKTRLAMEVAGALQHHFFDGVFYISAASLNNTQELATAIGAAIQLTFSEQGEALAQLVSYLQPREALLILDDFEHLVGSAPLLEHILENSSAVRFLVASRVQLNSRWERIYLLDGLGVGKKRGKGTDFSPGVELFLQSARRVQHDFALTEGETAIVEEICHQLDGLPLGIELAASWVSTLSCQQILEQIKRDIGFLDLNRSPAPRGVIGLVSILEYTWRLLSSEEQQTFTRLAVFTDVFTADAAEVVANASAAMLAEFVKRGMIRRLVSQGTEYADRYGIHQLWHQFAQEKLTADQEEDSSTRQVFRQYYGRVLADCVKSLNDPEMVQVRLNRDYNNIRRGWEEVFFHGDWEEFKRYTCDIVKVLEAQNRLDELAALLLQAIGRAETEPEAESIILAQWCRLIGEAHFRLGDLAESRSYLEKALAFLNFSLGSSSFLHLLALVKEILLQIRYRFWPGDQVRLDTRGKEVFREGAQAYERLGQVLFFEHASPITLFYVAIRGMNLAERVGPSAVLSRLYGNMIIGSSIIPAHAIAQFYRRLALKTAQQIQLQAALAWVLELSSIYRCGIGQWEEAEADALQAIDIAVSLGNTRRQDECWVMPAHIAHLRGDFRRSAEIWLDIYASAHRRGDVQAYRWGLSGQAENFLPLGRYKEAVSNTQTALDMELKVPDTGTDISCYGLMAKAYLKQEKWEQAWEAAVKGLRLMRETSPTVFSSLEGYAALAHVLLRLWGRRPQDAELARAASQAEGALWKFGQIFPIGRAQAHLYRGTLAWLRHKHQKALKAWQKGIEHAQAMHMPYVEALLFAEIARHVPENHPQQRVSADRTRALCNQLNVPIP